MFLFLSKLLPLFIYPLGLALWMLVAAIVLILRKRSRLALIPIALSTVILLVSSSGAFSSFLVRSLEKQNLPQPLPNAQAIAVLGGATQSALPPRPWVEMSDEGDRVLYAAKLYRDGKAPKVILSGGRIGWRGPGISEAEDMATFMETMGVPRSAMLLEPNSLNTRENAVNIQKIAEQNQISQMLLVTSAMHMPRSLMIFRKLGMNPIPATTDFIVTTPNQPPSLQSFLLNLLPEAENLRSTTRAIKEYIGMLIYWLKGWV
ncbi:YdcF family protein [Alkalinema pantanalense CENA528]|uniref:YdcF family protein n=1 Tax=Alkalinema pantanalense TaxID=1620705 RepID=UPI003D6F69A3